MDEFLEEVVLTLAPATERAYRIPLGLFLRHLRETLGREPTLDDLCVETARGWITVLRQRPKQVRAGTSVAARRSPWPRYATTCATMRLRQLAVEAAAPLLR